MGTLFSDTFNRLGATLGTGWTEQAGDFSTDGTQAILDATGLSIATADSTLLTDQYVQAWILSTQAPNNNAGIVFRFKDINNFYYAYIDPAAAPSPNIKIAKRVAGVFTVIDQGGTPGAGTYRRLAVLLRGSLIHVYFNNSYDLGAAKEGPVLAISDGSVTGAGRSGIISSGNNSSGSTGARWNDFIARDGAPDVIYVDVNFNGGAPGEGMGTQDRPDLGIDWALNNVGCVRGSKVKITNPGPIGDAASTVQYSIGHGPGNDGKFAATGFSFPTYSADSGAVVSEGNPNLIIEGMDGARTQLRDTVAPGKPFFRTRAKATGIVFRGLDFDLPDLNSSAFESDEAAEDHSVAFHKCFFDMRAGGAGQTEPVTFNAGLSVRFDFQYCYLRWGNAALEHVYGIGFTKPAPPGTLVNNVKVHYSVFQGQAGGEVSAFINVSTGVDIGPGQSWDFDHNTFVNIQRLFFNEAAISFLNNARITAAAVEIQNNVFFSDTPETTDYGTYTSSGALGSGGQILAHHNGYFVVDTPRDVGVTDGGNEAVSDPAFIGGAAHTWLHTSGKSLLGEGAFAAIVLDTDYHVLGIDYKDAADDSTPLQVLDKGALQDFFPVATAPPAGSPAPEIEVGGPAFCPSIIYDPLGPNETDLSGKLVDMRPLAQERDVLLRSYRASDLDLDFMDTQGLFLETNPATFLLGADGAPNWLGKPIVVAGLLGTQLLTRYRGFVVGVESERGIGRFRVANRLQFMFDRLVRANSIGRLVSTTGAVGIGPALTAQVNAPVSGKFLGNLTMLGQGPPFDPAIAPVVQTWTVTFTSSGVTPTFYVTGSETGFDGEGQAGVPFSYVSKSGSIAINTAVGGNFQGAAAATKDETCSLTTVWRALPASLTSVAALRAFLLDPRGGGQWPSGHGLIEADLDPGFDAFLGTVHDQTIDNVANSVHILSRLVIDSAKSVLDAIEEIARHSGVVVVELEDSRLGLVSLMPRQLAAAPEIICKSVDLISASVDHLPIYNDFAFEYDYDERLARFQEAEHYPTPAAANDSLTKYGRLYPAPSRFEFKAFTGSNLAWIQTQMLALYRRYRDPRRLYKLTAGIDRMDAELDDVYSVDSEAPTFQAQAVEPIAIGRRMTGDLQTEIETVDVSDFVAIGSGCGFAYHDQHPHDQCWTEF